MQVLRQRDGSTPPILFLRGDAESNRNRDPVGGDVAEQPTAFDLTPQLAARRRAAVIARATAADPAGASTSTSTTMPTAAPDKGHAGAFSDKGATL